ncbi:hypothetical protein [Catenulispora rubra]|uniref:hypothetical protein n=1 Tax=Catenulispora rubra TaxID=280293 RepID=UPI001891FA2D|nr:hypothetical protein [Catenulispora rubra]
MRLDSDYVCIETAAPAAEHPEAVDNSFDSVGVSVDEAVDNRSSEPLGTDAYVKLDAAISENGRPSRGSGLHPSIQTNHYQPSTVVTPAGYLTFGAVHITDQCESMARIGFEPSAEEYAAAYEILLLDIEPLNTVTIAELHAAGIADPTARQIAVRAADITTRPTVPDENQTQAASDTVTRSQGIDSREASSKTTGEGV